MAWAYSNGSINKAFLNMTLPTPHPQITGNLTGRTVRLDVWDALAHGPALFQELCHNPHNCSVWTYKPYGPFATQEEFLSILHHHLSQSNTCGYAIFRMGENAPVGLCGYTDIAMEHGRCEVAYLIFSVPHLQRTTAATEVLHLLVKNVFDLGYRRVGWKCHASNAASDAAAQRMGFTFEGRFRHHRWEKGINRDTNWYSITDTDWPSLCHAQKAWLNPINFDSQGQQKSALCSLYEN